MNLDPATLFLVLIGLCLISGGGMLLRLRTYPEDHYLRYWSAALLVAALALSGLSLRDRIPDWVSIELANMLSLIAFGLAWSGLRVFGGRQPIWWAVALAPAIWLASCAVPAIYGSMPYRTVVTSTLTTILSLMLATEVLRSRAERLPARIPLASLCGVHALATAIRAVLAFHAGWRGEVELPPLLYSVGLFEPILVLFGIVITGLSMTQQRRERDLSVKAAHDALTGMLNRGAFTERAEALILEARAQKQSVALLVFDIDLFKAVNDRYGHAAGDRALVAFADAARHILSAANPSGRIGGEEFAALLVGTDCDGASLVAERIRGEFARRTAAGVGITASASAGISVSEGAVMPLEIMMMRADEALYAAKRSGRNLVRRAAG